MWNYTSFENLTEAKSLFSAQDVISCVLDAETSSAYIFNGASTHANISKL
jgi:hypothetical protein